MLLKLIKYVGLSIAGLAWAGAATADSHGANTKSVLHAAEDTHLGGQFRAAITRHDNGLTKADGFTPDESVSVGVEWAQLTLDGKLNPKTDYSFRFNFLNSGIPDYGYGTHNFSKMFAFSIGMMKTQQGGHDNMIGNVFTITGGPYGSNLPFNMFEQMVALHMNAGTNKVTLQILNDKQGHFNTGKQKLTFNLGYTGTFGPISPLFHVGSYDNNKSMYVDVGIMLALRNGLGATLDYFHHDVKSKKQDSSDAAKMKEHSDVATSITLAVDYTMKKLVKPFFYYSMFDNKQSSDDGYEDAEFNTSVTDATTGVTTYSYNDNGASWGLGAYFLCFGANWNPYFVINSNSGKWEKTPGAGKDNTETKTEMIVKLGAIANF